MIELCLPECLNVESNWVDVMIIIIHATVQMDLMTQFKQIVSDEGIQTVIVIVLFYIFCDFPLQR